MIGVIAQRRVVLSIRRLSWLAYAAVVAVLLAYYVGIFRSGISLGVDFACFRAAAVVVSHGGNPYDFAQLWRAENALYNVPDHLQPGAPAYYYLDKYFNPPLFATAMTPFAHMPFMPGYLLYSVGVAIFAIGGTLLTLQALGWTRRRLFVVALVLASPSFFVALLNGQQSTLMLFLLGAALYAMRRGWPGLAGALLALTWVKPQLLVPFALAAPLLVPSWRIAGRWYAGFFATTASGIVLTALTTGLDSMAAWIHRLVLYSGAVGALHALPSLPGMEMDLIPAPVNKLVATGCTGLGIGLMITVVIYWRRHNLSPWSGMAVLIATWLLFTPYAHANDSVLLLAPLAVAWGRNGGTGQRVLPTVALWALSTLPLAFLLPPPWSGLDAVPVTLALVAACWTHVTHPKRTWTMA